MGVLSSLCGDLCRLLGYDGNFRGRSEDKMFARSFLKQKSALGYPTPKHGCNKNSRFFASSKRFECASITTCPLKGVVKIVIPVSPVWVPHMSGRIVLGT